MTKTFVSPFPQTQKSATAVVTGAVPLTGAGSVASDDATNTVLLFTVGAEGALLTRLSAMPRGTVTATSLLVFIRKGGDAAGARRLVDSAVMAAQNVNATTAINTIYFTAYNEGTPMRLAPGDEVYVGAGVALAAGISFRAEYSEF